MPRRNTRFTWTFATRSSFISYIPWSYCGNIADLCNNLIFHFLKIMLRSPNSDSSKYLMHAKVLIHITHKDLWTDLYCQIRTFGKFIICIPTTVDPVIFQMFVSIFRLWPWFWAFLSWLICLERSMNILNNGILSPGLISWLHYVFSLHL
jgi:hypothetical protein